MGRGETELEITDFLIIIRDEMGLNPAFFVIDYKPAWELALRKIFPNALIIRCGFHTVQLVNRGILTELNQLSQTKFKLVLKELKRLYQAIKQQLMQGEPLDFQCTTPQAVALSVIYNLLVELFQANPVAQVQACLDTILEQLTTQDTPLTVQLAAELRTRLPPNGLTARNLKYYRQKVKGALSLVLRQVRRQVKQAHKEFTRGKFLLLKRPEKLSAHELHFLLEFLDMYPEFGKYRELSLRISDIYHLPPERITRALIEDIELWEGAHPALQSAINTLKKNTTEILNFVLLYSQFPPKKKRKIPRVTPEPQMKKVKDLYRNKCGFRTIETTQLLLENQLQCPIFVCST